MQRVYGQDGQDSVTINTHTHIHIQVNLVSMLDIFYGSFTLN